jgi:hypothetical protein
LLGEGSAAEWANSFGINHPVIQDDGYAISSYYTPQGSIGLPNFTILSRELEVVAWYQQGAPPNMGLVDQLLQEDAPAVEYLMPEDFDDPGTAAADPNDRTAPDVTARGFANGSGDPISPFGGSGCAAPASIAGEKALAAPWWAAAFVLVGMAIRRRG